MTGIHNIIILAFGKMSKPKVKEKKVQETQCYVWDFTCDIDDPNPDVPKEEIIDFLNAISKKWAFQLERGETKKRRHYQGRFSLITSARLCELKKECPKVWHLTKTSNANKNNRFYVLKEETRVEGPWRDTPKYRHKMPYQWEKILEEPRPFQQQIIDSIGTKDARTINVIYDEHGNSGKSTFANRLEFEGMCYSLLPSKNTNEMCADLCDDLETAMDDEPGVIFVDMERASDQANMTAIFAALERIKGGIVRDRRYKTRKWFYASPPMWVFMNNIPRVKGLSMDRWRFWDMQEDKSLKRLTKARWKAAKAAERDARIAAEADEDEDCPPLDE